MRALAVAALCGLLCACGSGESTTGQSTGPSATPAPGTASATTSTTVTAPATVEFVGNTSCPTTGAQPYSPSPPGTNGPPIGEALPEMPHTHIAPPRTVNYLHNPPASGCHYSSAQPQAPLPRGLLRTEPRPEQWVHNLEHGYVVVLYHCPSGCADALSRLIDYAAALPPDVEGVVKYAKFLVVPDSALTTQFACVYWDWYLGLDTFDLTRIKAFYDNHTGHSPEGPGAG